MKLMGILDSFRVQSISCIWVVKSKDFSIKHANYFLVILFLFFSSLDSQAKNAAFSQVFPNVQLGKTNGVATFNSNFDHAKTGVIIDFATRTNHKAEFNISNSGSNNYVFYGVTTNTFVTKINFFLNDFFGFLFILIFLWHVAIILNVKTSNFFQSIL